MEIYSTKIWKKNTEKKHKWKKKRKLYYSINEVAQLLMSMFCYAFKKSFTVNHKPRKNAKGTLLYTKEDIDNIRLI